MSSMLGNIHFLINSLLVMAESLGTNSTTIRQYKTKVSDLIKLGNIGIDEYDIVSEIVGMKNTDIVKWGNVYKNIEMFNMAINSIIRYNNDLAIAITLEKLVKENKISKKIKDIVLRIYKIDSNKEINIAQLLNLGIIPEFTGFVVDRLKITKDDYTNSICAFNVFTDECKGNTIQLSLNSEYGPRCNVEDLRNNTELLYKLALGHTGYVGKNIFKGMTIDSHDAEVPDIKFELHKAATVFIKSIDWRIIYIDTMLLKNK